MPRTNQAGRVSGRADELRARAPRPPAHGPGRLRSMTKTPPTPPTATEIGNVSLPAAIDQHYCLGADKARQRPQLRMSHDLRRIHRGQHSELPGGPSLMAQVRCANETHGSKPAGLPSVSDGLGS